MFNFKFQHDKRLSTLSEKEQIKSHQTIIKQLWNLTVYFQFEYQINVGENKELHSNSLVRKSCNNPKFTTYKLAIRVKNPITWSCVSIFREGITLHLNIQTAMSTSMVNFNHNSIAGTAFQSKYIMYEERPE